MKRDGAEPNVIKIIEAEQVCHGNKRKKDGKLRKIQRYMRG